MSLATGNMLSSRGSSFLKSDKGEAGDNEVLFPFEGICIIALHYINGLCRSSCY